MICCNTRNNHYPFCLPLTGKDNGHLHFGSMLPSDGRKISDQDLSKLTEVSDLNGKRIILSNNEGRRDSEVSRRATEGRNLPPITLILHGRISDLERYGKTQNKLEIFRIFTDLLSVTIIGCDIHHTSIKTLVHNNKGKLDHSKTIYIRKRIYFE